MTMETITVDLNKQIAENARTYAKQRGTTLSALIEFYLLQLTQKEQTAEQEIPDIVLSLLGAGEPVEQDDLNGRKAYNEHLKRKYK